MDMIPIIHAREPKGNYIEITLDCGTVRYFTNIYLEYKESEMILIFRDSLKYFGKPLQPSVELRAFVALSWHLFGEYLKEYKPRKRTKIRRTNSEYIYNDVLYILRSELGFIKVGISGNFKRRIRELRTEFGCEFEIINVHSGKGDYEGMILKALKDYSLPIVKKSTNTISTECFKDCKEVLNIVNHKLS